MRFRAAKSQSICILIAEAAPSAGSPAEPSSTLRAKESSRRLFVSRLQPVLPDELLQDFLQLVYDVAWQFPVDQRPGNPDTGHTRGRFSEYNTFSIAMQCLNLIALTAPCIGNIVVDLIRDDGMEGIVFLVPQRGHHPWHHLKPEGIIQKCLRWEPVTEDILNLLECQGERGFFTQSEKFP